MKIIATNHKTPRPIRYRCIWGGMRVGLVRGGWKGEGSAVSSFGENSDWEYHKNSVFWCSLTFIIISPLTINANEVGGWLVGLYGGWEGVGSSYKNAVVGGRTRAMVSDELLHYFFNNQCLTLILPRSFNDMTAGVMAKFQVGCCFGCRAMGDGNPMVAASLM